MTDASLVLEPLAAPVTGAQIVPNSSGCSLCPYMAFQDPANPGKLLSPVQVVLLQSRGRFDGGVTKSSGRYHAAYINDSWAMGKHVTLNLGLRWEQQRLVGNQLSKLFNDMWSPRFGFIVDPKGNRKTKFYANYGRYAFILPLDAAVRALSAEDDVLGAYWQPATTTTGCPAGTPSGASCVKTDSSGNPDYANMFQPGSATLLNSASGGIGNAVTVGLSGGEPFQPGIRMEYTDEYVAGFQHEFRGGIVFGVRYIDRRLKRVIEDQGGISVEQFDALANNNGGLNYFIGNPDTKQDIFVNPNEITFGLGTDFTPAQQVQGNLPAACVDSNGFATAYVAWDVLSPLTATAGQTVVAGSACFPSVNQPKTWSIPDPVNPGQFILDPKAEFGGEFHPDGKPDTYKDP